MAESIREELKAEYTILQSQYEAFDARALTIKSWSAPLIAGGVGVGLKENVALIVAAIVAALCLWLMEAIWKSFQYCYTDRIKLIEAWFREENRDIVPFQIFSAWIELYHRWYIRRFIVKSSWTLILTNNRCGFVDLLHKLVGFYQYRLLTKALSP